jgi:hypothetical protein
MIAIATPRDVTKVKGGLCRPTRGSTVGSYFQRGMLVALSHLSSVASDRRTVVVVVRRCCHQSTEMNRVVNCFGRSTSLRGKWGASPFFLAEPYDLCSVGVVLRVEWPFDRTRRGPRFCALTSSTSMQIRRSEAAIHASFSTYSYIFCTFVHLGRTTYHTLTRKLIQTQNGTFFRLSTEKLS